MFAKSMVKAPMCTSTTGCTPPYTECCAENNPVYTFLHAKMPREIGRNYDKYLIVHNGTVLKHFTSTYRLHRTDGTCEAHNRAMPKGLVEAIEAALEAPKPSGSGRTSTRGGRRGGDGTGGAWRWCAISRRWADIHDGALLLHQILRMHLALRLRY
jgi:hypothetical protein